MRDADVELFLGRLLQTGVLIAGAVVAIGGAIYLVHHGAAHPDNRVFHSEPVDLRTLTGILHDVRAGSGRGIIQFGLLLLIATPIARVAFSVYAFAREHDYRYVAITLIVLGLLLYSLFSSV